MSAPIYRLQPLKHNKKDFIETSDSGYTRSRFSYTIQYKNKETRQTEEVWVNGTIFWDNNSARTNSLWEAQAKNQIARILLLKPEQHIIEKSMHEGKLKFELTLNTWDVAVLEFLTEKQYEKFKNNIQPKNNLETKETTSEDDSFDNFI